MPRESVMGDDRDGTEVKIGWDHHGNVQVGVSAAGPFAFNTPLPDGVSMNGPYHDLWVSLSRQGCNDLIRKLRKARDAAHGRDE